MVILEETSRSFRQQELPAWPHAESPERPGNYTSGNCRNGGEATGAAGGPAIHGNSATASLRASSFVFPFFPLTIPE